MPPRETQIPAIPDPPASADPALRKFLASLKEAVEVRLGRRGDPLDEGLTKRDLVGLGGAAIALRPDGSQVTNGGINLTQVPAAVETPEDASGLAATASVRVVHLRWDPPTYSGHSHTEVWRATSDDFNAKVLQDTPADDFWFDQFVSPETDYYYWVRHVNTADRKGGFNGVAGTLANTQVDPAYVFSALTEQPFFEVTTPTTLNGQTVPAGTYMRDAYIQNGTISFLAFDLASGNRVFANDGTFGRVLASELSVLNANIKGTIQSDDYLAGSTGWAISKVGAAEFNTVTVRGTIYGGAATAFDAGVGLFAGDVSGTYKFRLGDPNGAKIEWDGSVLTGSLDRVLTFYGSTTYTTPALTDVRLEAPEIAGTPRWFTDAGDTWVYGHSSTGDASGVWSNTSSPWCVPNSSTASSWASETYALTRVVISEFRVTYSVTAHSGTVTAKLRTKQSIGDSWTEHTLSGSGSDSVRTAARYVSILFETTGVLGVTGNPTLTILAESTKEIFDVTTSAAGAVTVTLGGEYESLSEVRFTTSSATPVIVTYSNETLGVGVTNTVDVKAWDANAPGTLIATNTRMTVEGINGA